MKGESRRRENFVVKCKTLLFYEEAEEIYFCFGVYKTSGDYCLLGGRMDSTDANEFDALSREVREESATTLELKKEFIFDSYTFESMNLKYTIFYTKIDYPNFVSTLNFKEKRKDFEEKSGKYSPYLEMKDLKWVGIKDFFNLLSGGSVDGVMLWDDDKSYILHSLPEKIKKLQK